ncbi:uncharacterized protein LOC127448925 isoform X2 [Myxocyprinus asiaticus]|uniref:uncharacterized protein LOC127448925 isoform X2 n=1 Tax=Myxocyprinus asiaticus TaxID=70543 RepID=UPI002222C1F5|nr:uncharacterized protein LOC127448925 isoform X2 [Myxocyprinus asiaticus]
MDSQEDLIDRDITLIVQLPGGQETTATVHGSKPVMDVLVTLCAQHHLIPSDNVIKLMSTNQNHINFKPNSPIGSLEFERVVLQAKGSDDANRKKPHMPVATVRLLINYKKSHKAVVRVNPRVPLAELMPAVCEKCEFDPDTTVLLRTCQSEEPLDLTKSLNDYGMRELYAKDTKVSGGEEKQKTPGKEKNHSEKENKGFFALFKKSKKTPEQAVTVSAPSSPELNAVGVTCLNGHSTLSTAPADMTKKRRAPKPPLTMSQSVSCELHTTEFTNLSEHNTAGKQGLLSRISSTESSLKRTKRRAPPPPCDGPSPSNSNGKEEAEEEDSSSDKDRACIAGHCPSMAEVMTELAESLQARQQRVLCSANSSTSQHCPTEDHFQGLRNPSERDGMTTFTVVPQRRQPTRKCFEVALMLQAPDTAKAEEKLCPGAPLDLEIHGTELVEEAVPIEPFRNGDNGFDKSEHLSGILQHLEKENQEWTDSETENLEPKFEKQSIHLRNIELEGLESFQRGLNNLELFGSAINDLEIRAAELNNSEVRESLTSNLELADKRERSPIDSNIKGSLVELDEIPEYALVETRKERDWMEEYKERRSKFLGGDNDGRRKLDSWERFESKFINTAMKTRMQGINNNFPPLPPLIYWYEDNSESKNEEERDKENENKQDEDAATNNQSHDKEIEQRPKLDLSHPLNQLIGADFDSHFTCSDCNVRLNSEPKYAPFPHLSKPKVHSTQTNPEPNSPGVECKFSSTSESYRTSCLLPQHSPGCTSKAHSTFDPCPPETVSPFALAVFQKAKHFRPGLDSQRSRKQELPMHTKCVLLKKESHTHLGYHEGS